jgi:oxygen-independent coproporphyrinogen-3 oxidase
LYASYLDALQKEIEGAHASLWPHLSICRLKARTVYFGGGTPSLIRPEAIAQLLRSVRQRFTVAEGFEVSLEANPGTVEPTSLSLLLEAGVSRISLGFQTLDDHLLLLFRRGHSAADAVNAFRMARAVGFTNINVDLMYGLPGQTLEAWRRDLAAVLELEPDHLSAYQLTVHPGTALYWQVVNGMVQLPEPDLAADMYLLACEMLASAGYEHYEIANWGRKICRHNLIYWRREPYMGFGAGAHSFIDEVRYWNVAHPGVYVARILSGGVAVEGQEETVGPVAAAERAMLALRLRSGLSDAELKSLYPSVRDKAAEGLRRFQDYGLARRVGSRWRLTEQGWLVANYLFEKLLP